MKLMKVILTGSTGMLGSDCKNVLEEKYQVITADKAKMDITSWDRCTEVLHKLNADVVVNCAGFNDMAACEQDDLLISKMNVEGPRNLAQCSARYAYRMVHISCYCIFDGTKVVPQPYFEDDVANPLSAYGKLKRDSEIAVRENAPYHVIIRTGWLYGKNGNNFLKTLIQKVIWNKEQPLKVPADQIGCPTWSRTLAHQISEIVHSQARGTYHASAEGFCSLYDFAARLFSRLELSAKLEPVRGSENPLKMPLNAILENRFLKKQGINIMEDWNKDLDCFIDLYGEDLIHEAETSQR
jgi:dTDP-4-dehydrorhamnose reductase